MNIYQSFNRSVTTLCWITGVVVATFVISPPLDAQVDDQDRSHVVFDINVEKLRVPMAAISVDIDDLIHAMTEGNVSKEIASKIKRASGSLELPSDMKQLEATAGPLGLMGAPEGRMRDSEKKMALPDPEKTEFGKDHSDKEPTPHKKMIPDESDGQPISTGARRQPTAGHLPHHQEETVPINFFLRIELMDEEATRQLTETVKGRNAGQKTINGKSYFTAGEYGPTNLLMHNPTATSFEIGTTDYVTNSDRKVLTDRCKEVWKATPNHAIRIAGELDSIEPLIVEFTDMISRDAPPMAVGGIRMIQKISAIQVTLDMETENLLTLNLEGKDEAAASEINSVLSGLLMLGKGAFGQFKNEFDREFPAGAEMMHEIVNDLEITSDGKSVSLVVPKPTDFEERVAKIAKETRAAAKKVDEMNRLRQVALSVHNYESAYRKFPFVADGEQSKQLSWRGRISPFLEGPPTEATKAHDEGANADAVSKMPEPMGSDKQNTNVFFVRSDNPPTRFRDLLDGSSNTIMLVQTNSKTVPWLEPGDLSIDETIELITGLKDDETIIVGFYDGSVSRLRAGITAEQIQPFLTHKGDEIVERDTIDR